MKFKNEDRNYPMCSVWENVQGVAYWKEPKGRMDSINICEA